MIRILINTFIVILLTILTQVGGIAYLSSLWISKKIKFRSNQLILPIATYLFFTFVLVPILAPVFGRVKITDNNKITHTSYMTVLLNRNYVTKELNNTLLSISKRLPDNITLKYLDACFPFIDGFPLLPHLSHKDGKKIDISLMYNDETGQISNYKPSNSGYGVFVEPTAKEFNQTEYCLTNGYWQYDYPKYLTLGKNSEKLDFSATGTKTLLNVILEESNISKVFIEKHLRTRMGLEDNRLRFQGCRAVRHDDHIHIQIK